MPIVFLLGLCFPSNDLNLCFYLGVTISSLLRPCCSPHDTEKFMTCSWPTQLIWFEEMLLSFSPQCVGSCGLGFLIKTHCQQAWEPQERALTCFRLAAIDYPMESQLIRLPLRPSCSVLQWTTLFSFLFSMLLPCSIPASRMFLFVLYRNNPNLHIFEILEVEEKVTEINLLLPEFSVRWRIPACLNIPLLGKAHQCDLVLWV